MSALAGAIDSGSLSNVAQLSLYKNQISHAGVTPLAGAIASGSLSSLRILYVDDGALGTKHPQLKAACDAREIPLR